MPRLSSQLREFKPWFMEVTSLRDPAAHRIPPGFVTGRVANEDLPEFNRLMAEAEQSFADAGKVRGRPGGESFDFEASMADHQRVMELIYRGFELRYEAESLSKFTPMIFKFTTDGYEIAWAPSLIPRDQMRFVEIGTYVVRALSRQDT